MYDVVYYVLAGIMAGIGGTWVFLIKSMADSFRLAPYLDVFEDSSKNSPRVSVILPARNEEEFIDKCLESLAAQDYDNYEVIAVDDSSEDDTGRIISKYSKKHPEIVPVSAGPKPDGWMGKNWACMEGYKKAGGQLLLFTDADTVHSKSVISLAVAHLQSLNLDALSAIPRMQTFDFWTRAALPMISVFLHTRFSALNVNNPAKKTGYFFGSFFILRRETYEGIGMHEGVRGEAIEDGALGKRAKEAGYKIRMVRGEHLIKAVWARDPSGLWNALKRLMAPLYQQSKKIAVGILLAVSFLLFVPFPVLVASALAGGEPAMVLCVAAGVASALIYAGAALEARAGLGLRVIYAALAPLGGLTVILGFLAGMRGASVAWRGRTYLMRDKKHGSAEHSNLFR